MASIYTIEFTDPTLPGKSSFSINPGDYDGPGQLTALPPQPSKSHTSLTLFGQGALRYGQLIGDDFVHLLENFASDGLEPVNPTVGQLWFDSSQNTMKVYNINEEWVVSIGGTEFFEFPIQSSTMTPVNNFLVSGNLTNLLTTNIVTALGGLAGVGYFSVAGNQKLIFLPGSNFVVSGTPANDGTYTVNASPAPSFDGTNTLIMVTVLIPASQSAVGLIIPPIPFKVDGTPGGGLNDGTYTVATFTYNGILDQTTITTNEAVPATQTAGGFVQFSPLPLNPALGQIYYDFVSDSMYAWNGSDWIPVVLGSGGIIAAGDLNMNGFKIINLADPTTPTGAVNVQFADTNYVNVTGDSMTGSLSMGTNQITSLGAPVAGTDAANKTYVDTKVTKTGDTMTGNLTMSGAGVQVILPNAPTIGTHATNKTYVDAAVASAFPSGGMIDFGGSVAPSGWYLTDGASYTVAGDPDLFAVIGYTFGGSGASFNVPNNNGRTTIGPGAAVQTETFSFTAVAANIITVTSNNDRWITGMLVSIAGTGITVTGSFYIIRVSTTAIRLASSLANAQNGTFIALTPGAGSSVITYTGTTRTLGTTGGEETHAMSISELLSHTHVYTRYGGLFTADADDDVANTMFSPTSISTSAAGGNSAMNITQLYIVTPKIIKR